MMRIFYAFLSRGRGSALLIALSFLVLLTIVALALFSSTRTDLRNASAFSKNMEALRLAETCINLVQGQIADASSNPRVSWVSQPGMIRSLDTSGNVTAYKLYSSPEMVVAGFGKAQIDAERAAMANWNAGATTASFNALWCDLNAPAVVPRPNPVDPAQTINVPVFPIIDPGMQGNVQGFSFDDTAVAGTRTGVVTDPERRLPMPVRWLYILKDGTLTAPQSGDAGTATFVANAPTRANPIVARVAFWTDDETCKININTASEGTFWDAPKANVYADVRMAIAMPMQGEFQRLTNHPAFTSLSPVFGAVSANYNRPAEFLNRTSNIDAEVSDPDSYYRNFVNYYRLTPRIHGELGTNDKSSKGGAQRTSVVGRGGTSEAVNAVVWPVFDQPADSEPGVAQRKGAPVILDTDRLYATPDEILFDPSRNLHPDFTAAAVSARQFFLTASSRAPETTLLGTPRVSLWPQQVDANDRNIRDRLLHHCTQVGGHSYSFFRQIAQDGIYTSAEYPADSPVADVNLSANQRLLNYLRGLMAQPMPGYGSSLDSKWSAQGSHRVLAQAFDVIRAHTNSSHTNFGGSAAGAVTYRYAVTTRNPRQYIAPSPTHIHDKANGPANTVVPARLEDDVRGMGRFILIDEAALVVMASKVQNTYNHSSGTIIEISDGETRTQTKDGSPDTTDVENIRPVAQTTQEVSVMLLLHPYLTAAGTPAVTPGMQVEVEGFGSMSLNGTPFLTGGGALRLRAGSQASNNAQQQNRFSGLFEPFGSFQVFANRPNAASMSSNQNPPGGSTAVDTRFKDAIPGGTDMDLHYALVSNHIPVAGPTVSFSGGTLTVRIRNWRGGEVVQTLRLSFPPASFVTPQHIRKDAIFAGGLLSAVNLSSWGGEQVYNLDEGKNNGDWLSPRKRLIGNFNGSETMALAVRPGDVVLGVGLDPAGPARGDLRALAVRHDVPANWFKEHPDYGLVNTAFIGTTAGASPGNTQDAVRGRYAFHFRSESTSQYDSDQEVGWVRDGSSKNIRLRQARELNEGISSARPHTLITGLVFQGNAQPWAAGGMNGARLADGSPGDWASGIGASPDGAIFSIPDTGDSNLLLGGYFGNKFHLRVPAGDTWEPNRLVPSAGQFGQLMTPDSSGEIQPWQTLLFTSRPAAGTSHPGRGTSTRVPDHVFLDFFWMPVVEPYPISDPLSTAGKVNLNFALAPFTHIERSTALRGALQALRVNAVPDTAASAGSSSGSNYKRRNFTQPANVTIRHELNLEETIKSFRQRLENGEIFRSATQVAETDLVPAGQTLANLNGWWNSRRVTSDTLREQPYTALLGRITTRSNTYTVHYRVQVLRQTPRPGRNWAEWEEAKDVISAEFRGAATIERYLDPNATTIPDYATVDLSSDYTPVDRYYRWRVIAQRAFAP